MAPSDYSIAVISSGGGMVVVLVVVVVVVVVVVIVVVVVAVLLYVLLIYVLTRQPEGQIQRQHTYRAITLTHYRGKRRHQA